MNTEKDALQKILERSAREEERTIEKFSSLLFRKAKVVAERHKREEEKK